MAVSRSYPPFVYFVRRTDGEGPIKIGCSQWPEQRLSSLMQWAPYPLEIVVTIPGSEDLERRFHARFAEHHSHREWFHPDPSLIEAITEIQAEAFDVSSLPAPKVVTGTVARKQWTEDQRLAVRWRNAADRMKRLGQPIPEDVCKALQRWRSERFGPNYESSRRFDPADRATLEAFFGVFDLKVAA